MATIDWRPLLDSIRIPWRDRGSNTSAGNVNVCCPLCRDDRGYHLSLAEGKEAFYCWRNPSQHRGTNLGYILTRLGVRPDEVDGVLARFSRGPRSAPRVALTDAEIQAIHNSAQSRWERLDSAADSSRVMSYLTGRGYPRPEHVARRYDLRMSPSGKWSGRLLLPVRIDGHVISWVGRSVLPAMKPKYLVEAEGEAGQGLLYAPSEVGPGARCIVVEGPLDALKINAAEVPGVAAVALMGKASNASKLLRLSRMLRECAEFYICLDTDAALNEFYAALRELGGMGMGLPSKGRRLTVPEGFKDPGEMSLEDIHLWIKDRL